MNTIQDAYFSDLIARLTAVKAALTEPMAQAVDAIV